MHRNLPFVDTPPANAKNRHFLVSSHLSTDPTIVIKNAFFSDGPTDYSRLMSSRSGRVGHFTQKRPRTIRAKDSHQ